MESKETERCGIHSVSLCVVASEWMNTCQLIRSQVQRGTHSTEQEQLAAQSHLNGT